MLNIVTICAIYKTSTMPKTLKTLLLSLACSDVTVGLFSQPLYTFFLINWLRLDNPSCNTQQAIGTVVSIMIRQREPKTRIGRLCVKHEVARAMLFCAIQQNANGRNFSFRNSPQCPIYIINSDKIELSCNSLTEVASQFFENAPPLFICSLDFCQNLTVSPKFCSLLANIISYPDPTLLLNGNVSYNCSAVKGVGTGLPTSRPFNFTSGSRRPLKSSSVLRSLTNLFSFNFPSQQRPPPSVKIWGLFNWTLNDEGYYRCYLVGQALHSKACAAQKLAC